MSAIIVENLSKCYQIGRQVRHDTLRDALMHKLGGLLPGRRKDRQAEAEDFWALRDVSFKVEPGEVVGIIGRNGAGKSTLLKILSRITEPTQGRIKINGRIASLLEVGTGFHPELTGRDNIYLNGAILGMSRVEIRKKFDEIVAFAEVEKFLDTPVKRYSSGMYVRLAFSVAAHLEPEILIVDEVLAVGDAAFQKKCLGKLREVANQEGRTIIFVSHDLAAVSSITSRCLMLQNGTVIETGPTTETIASYIKTLSTKAHLNLQSPATNCPHISEVVLTTSEGGNIHSFGQPLEVKITIKHPVAINQAGLSFQIINQYQQAAIHSWIYHTDRSFADCPGETILTCKFKNLKLNIGNYHLRIYLSEPPGGKLIQKIDQACHFDVIVLGRTTLWGWRPDACVYHENSEWIVSPK